MPGRYEYDPLVPHPRYCTCNYCNDPDLRQATENEQLAAENDAERARWAASEKMKQKINEPLAASRQGSLYPPIPKVPNPPFLKQLPAQSSPPTPPIPQSRAPSSSSSASRGSSPPLSAQPTQFRSSRTLRHKPSGVARFFWFIVGSILLFAFLILASGQSFNVSAFMEKVTGAIDGLK